MAYAGIETGSAGLRKARKKVRSRPFDYRPRLLFRRLLSTESSIEENCSYSGKCVYNHRGWCKGNSLIAPVVNCQ